MSVPLCYQSALVLSIGDGDARLPFQLTIVNQAVIQLEVQLTPSQTYCLTVSDSPDVVDGFGLSLQVKQRL